MVIVTTDFRKLEFALARLSDAAKIGLGPIIKEEARFLVRIITKFTPPKSKKQGENAVQSDMSKLAKTLDENQLDSRASKGGFYASMAKYTRARDTEKLRMLFQNPGLRYYVGRRMLGSVDEIRLAHLQQRNKRGRIPKDANNVAYLSDMKKFAKEIRGRVGWTLSGWIPAAKATGAPFKKFSDRFGDKAGTVTSNFVGTRPFIVAVNRNVKIPNYQRTIDAAVASRTRTTLLKINRVLANRAVNLGFTRVGGRALPIAA